MSSPPLIVVRDGPWSLSVFETAIRADSATLEASPLLSTDWNVAEGGLSIDMTSRDDVCAHSGRAMTADDVEFSYEAAANPDFASQLGFIARQFDGEDTIDKANAAEMGLAACVWTQLSGRSWELSERIEAALRERMTRCSLSPTRPWAGLNSPAWAARGQIWE